MNEQNPAYQIKQQQQALANYRINLGRAMQQQLDRYKQQLAMQNRQLNAISPLSTLQRGYAIVTEKTSGALVKQPDQVAPGDKLAIRLNKGEIDSTVDAIHKK